MSDPNSYLEFNILEITKSNVQVYIDPLIFLNPKVEIIWISALNYRDCLQQFLVIYVWSHNYSSPATTQPLLLSFTL